VDVIRDEPLMDEKEFQQWKAAHAELSFEPAVGRLEKEQANGKCA
jgi:hypothetical protein